MSDNPYQSPKTQPAKPSDQEGASALDAIIPTNPLAAVSCYTGIFSILCCFAGVVLGPAAIIIGFLAINKWKMQETAYGATTSKIRAWIGIITGFIGLATSVLAIVVTIFSNT